jgi:hypothetical protein
MNPSDFYFAIYDDEEDIVENGFIIVITSKAIWDNEGVWDDSGDAIDCVPLGFYELTEAEFEYSNGKGKATKQEAERLLLNAGFIKNNNIL